MNLKRTVKALMVTSLTLALPSMPMAGQSRDRALFMADTGAAGYRNAPAILGGQALVDDALARIVPSPYRIMLDESVPASMRITWGSGDNWMAILTRSLAPIGLVAEPDWAKNVIKISWLQRRPAPAPVSEQRIAAAPAAPAQWVGQSGMNGGMNETPAVLPQQQPQPQRAGGKFVVMPEQLVAVPAPRAIECLEAEAPVIQARFLARRTGELPEPAVMWELMRAAVNGDKIVLTGVSTLSDEKQRTRYALVYANKLRERMLAIGFPAHSVVIGDRHSDRANKPGVRIVIIKGEV